MGKRILMLLFVCVLSVHMVFSQSSNTSKQINDIKRDGQYFYAESTLETEAAAHESATLMLANFINDYVNSNNLPSDKKVAEKDLADAKSLTMKRGPMVRVFIYVKKSDFVPAETANQSSTKEDITVQKPEIEKKVVEVAEKPEAKKQNSEEQNTEKQNSEKQNTEKQDISKQESEVKQTDAPEQRTLPVESNASETKLEDLPQTEATDANSSLRLPVEWQQAAIDSMLKESSLKGVMPLLNRLQAEYKIKRFGTYNECRNAALSFWIICENDSNMSLITILGPGTDSRVNFKTLTHDSLGNYSGKNAIWFELAK